MHYCLEGHSASLFAEYYQPGGMKMNETSLLALQMMARRVSEDQNCVMELIIGEEGMLAHLIPRELWEDEMDGGGLRR